MLVVSRASFQYVPPAGKEIMKYSDKTVETSSLRKSESDAGLRKNVPSKKLLDKEIGTVPISAKFLPSCLTAKTQAFVPKEVPDSFLAPT
jgi:hypothetical protein